jgi:6-pyruvoyltetrahydropterin/6-carboxytetrahydropterin synthase
MLTTLTRRYHFSAAHRLWNLSASPEENQQYFGDCGGIHGHNYTLDVSVTGPIAEKTGMIMDIWELDKLVQEQVLQHVDHKYLNDVSFLSEMVLTLENVTQCFYQRLDSHIPQPAKLYKLCLYESETNWVEVVGEG